jgi:hypothetical protein
MELRRMEKRKKMRINNRDRVTEFDLNKIVDGFP